MQNCTNYPDTVQRTMTEDHCLNEYIDRKGLSNLGMKRSVDPRIINPGSPIISAPFQYPSLNQLSDYRYIPSRWIQQPNEEILFDPCGPTFGRNHQQQFVQHPPQTPQYQTVPDNIQYISQKTYPGAATFNIYEMQPRVTDSMSNTFQPRYYLPEYVQMALPGRSDLKIAEMENTPSVNPYPSYYGATPVYSPTVDSPLNPNRKGARSFSTVVHCEILGNSANDSYRRQRLIGSRYRMPLITKAPKADASPPAHTCGNVTNEQELSNLNDSKLEESRNAKAQTSPRNVENDGTLASEMLKSTEKKRPLTAEEMISLIRNSSSNESALEMLKKANEDNLSFVKSAQANVKTLSQNVSFADVDEARKVMKKLNPSIKDEDKLMAILQEYAAGKPLDLRSLLNESDLEVSGKSTDRDKSGESRSCSDKLKRMLIPVNPSNVKAERNNRVGFQSSHQFTMKL